MGKKKAGKNAISTEPLPLPFESLRGWEIIKDALKPTVVSIKNLELISIFTKEEGEYYRSLKTDFKFRWKYKPQRVNMDKLVEVVLTVFDNAEKMKKKFGINVRRGFLIDLRSHKFGVNLGERHARCLLKQQKSFPVNWLETKPTIVFPGTIWGKLDLWYVPDSCYDPNNVYYSNSYMPKIFYDVEKANWEISYFSIDSLLGLDFIEPDENICFLRQKP